MKQTIVNVTKTNQFEGKNSAISDYFKIAIKISIQKAHIKRMIKYADRKWERSQIPSIIAVEKAFLKNA